MERNKDIIEPLLQRYFESFQSKTYSVENNEYDILMNIFGITPELKRQNRQYWGRELGMLWQLIVTSLCQRYCADFAGALRVESDEPCDLIIGRDAIDTKYRIGSGDSGTLKKFKQYGNLLIEKGYRPVFLILREDNLPAAITACNSGNWTVLIGSQAFDYLEQKTGVNVYKWLESYSDKYQIG